MTCKYVLMCLLTVNGYIIEPYVLERKIDEGHTKDVIVNK